MSGRRSGGRPACPAPGRPPRRTAPPRAGRLGSRAWASTVPWAPDVGVDAFIDEQRGSTTLAAAVAILVSLALVFGLANVTWVASRSADVQAVADAGALACMNVLSSYATAAQILDALVLSLGLVGMLVMAIGLVLSAIPGLNGAGPPVVSAAVKVFDARAKLSRSAAAGLQKIEKVLPYLMAANSLLAVRANASDEGSYVGIAIPYPLDSASDFGLLSTDSVADKAAGSIESSEILEELTAQAQQAKEAADEALERGWMANCGAEPNCMRERAGQLAGLSGALNPDYPTTTGWDFSVPIARARAYYQARISQEAPEGGGALELSRSCARAAFYEYALEQVGQSSFTRNEDGTVSCDLRSLPKNTDEVRQTRLYTDVVWPCTDEPDGRTIHCSLSCPGASGSPSGMASLADEESGAVRECPICQFTVTDVGRAPAASTNIENGFEHHWRDVVEASKDYEASRNEQAQREAAARQEAEKSRDLFSEALEALKVTRVELSPPGRYGCVCVVADPSTHLAPSQLATLVGSGARLPARVAVSAAVLAKDPASGGNNVLGNFFDSLVARGGFVGGAGGVLDAVMSAWGGLLVSYDSGYNAFMGAATSSFQTLAQLGLGGVSTWLKDALDSVIELTGMQPADMSAKKPVLANSGDVMARAGNDWYSAVQALVVAAPSLAGADSPQAMLAALGVFVESLTGSSTITLAEVGIPGSEATIPLEVDLGELAQAAGGP